MAETQTLQNHTRLLPPFHFFVLPVLGINFFYVAWTAVRAPSFATLWAAVVAAALATLGVLARTMTLVVQDRVIRLEMRHRLKDVLPSDLRGRIADLTPRQLVALRFASDDEMPALVREVLAGSLPSPKAIKQSVKSWQGDYLRC
jgi:Family of unknown function (DUF6526)